MASKVTGRVEIELDGETLESEAGATIDVGGVTAEPLVTETGNVYPIETSVPATVECSILHLTGTDLVALAGIRNATLNFKCDSGQVYTVGGAFITKPPTMSGGKAALSFAGRAAITTAK